MALRVLDTIFSLCGLASTHKAFQRTNHNKCTRPYLLGFEITGSDLLVYFAAAESGRGTGFIDGTTQPFIEWNGVIHPTPRPIGDAQRRITVDTPRQTGWELLGRVQ
jgi:hypothetical protein